MKSRIWKWRKRLGLTWRDIRVPFWFIWHAIAFFDRFSRRLLEVDHPWWKAVLYLIPMFVGIVLCVVAVIVAVVPDLLTFPLQYLLYKKLMKEAERNKAMLAAIKPPELKNDARFAGFGTSFGAGKTAWPVILGGAAVAAFGTSYFRRKYRGSYLRRDWGRHHKYRRSSRPKKRTVVTPPMGFIAGSMAHSLGGGMAILAQGLQLWAAQNHPKSPSPPGVQQPNSPIRNNQILKKQAS